jgi:hypothetical protein
VKALVQDVNDLTTIEDLCWPYHGYILEYLLWDGCSDGLREPRQTKWLIVRRGREPQDLKIEVVDLL